MRIGFALLKKENDVSQNLKQILVYLKTAQKHQVDFVLFSKDFLNHEPITISDMSLFSIKQACIVCDVTCGIGFIEKDESAIYHSYLVINTHGEVINHARFEEPNEVFYFQDKPFQVIFDVIQSSSSFTSLLLLDEHVSEQEWFHHRLDFYQQQSKGDVLAINAYQGGAFYLKDKRFILNQPTQQMGLSITDL